MKLFYRGVNYDRVLPAIKTVKGEVMGKYRGAPWSQQVLESIPVVQPVHNLKYRGVEYRSGETDGAKTAVTVQSRNTSPTRRVLSTSELRHLSVLEIAQIHHNNIRQRLEHRLQVAKAKGDENLVRLLEVEQQQIA